MSSFQIFDTTAVTQEKIIQEGSIIQVFDETSTGPFSATGSYLFSLNPGLPLLDSISGPTGTSLGDGTFNIVTEFSCLIDNEFPLVTAAITRSDSTPSADTVSYGTYQLPESEKPAGPGQTGINGETSLEYTFVDEGLYLYLIGNYTPPTEFGNNPMTLESIRIRAYRIES